MAGHASGREDKLPVFIGEVEFDYVVDFFVVLDADGFLSVIACVFISLISIRIPEGIYTKLLS